MIIVTNANPGLTQSDFNPFTYDLKFEDLNIYTDPNIPKAPVVIDGREIFSVGKVGGNSAGERADVIEKELLEAIKSSNFTEVIIEEQDRLPVL